MSRDRNDVQRLCGPAFCQVEKPVWCLRFGVFGIVANSHLLTPPPHSLTHLSLPSLSLSLTPIPIVVVALSPPVTVVLRIQLPTALLTPCVHLLLLLSLTWCIFCSQQSSLGVEQILGNFLLGTVSSLNELRTNSKSGATFYFSHDARYCLSSALSLLSSLFSSPLFLSPPLLCLL